MRMKRIGEVGKTESMEEVFKALSDFFAKPIKLEHQNKNAPSKNPVLTLAQKEKVFRLYEEDFKVLPYER